MADERLAEIQYRIRDLEPSRLKSPWSAIRRPLSKLDENARLEA